MISKNWGEWLKTDEMKIIVGYIMVGYMEPQVEWPIIFAVSTYNFISFKN